MAQKATFSFRVLARRLGLLRLSSLTLAWNFPLSLTVCYLPSRASPLGVSSALAPASEAPMYTLIYLTTMSAACGLLAYLTPLKGS